jgi:hypothetical protein
MVEKHRLITFECKDCKNTFKTLNGLTVHISIYHNKKEYYDKWIKTNQEGICVICNKNTDFISITKGYKNTCSRECTKTHMFAKQKETLLKNYGIINIFQKEEIKQKIKETKLKKYGNENFNNSIKNKQTKLKKYGNENYVNSEKNKQTNIHKYGINYASKRIDISRKIRLQKYKNGWFNDNKIKETNLKKYGVEYNHQNLNILEKSLKSSFKLKQFRNTNIWYQGSYELNFLEKYYDKYPDIQRGHRIKYEFEGKIKYYFPDFYIPSLNLIIECKNSYLLKKDKPIIKIKEEATINNGFNYKIIVDKNYKNLNI